MSLINVNDLNFAYEGSFDAVFEHVSFSIDTDWKLGFVGRNGRGKTTFLKLLMGQYPYEGSISSGVPFAYFPYAIEDESQLALDVALACNERAEEWMLLRELSLMQTRADVLYRPYDTLSKGEQTKLMLAALFCGDGRFLLIDEPTDHLDMYARDIVGNYLNGKKGFILVSHDRAFLDSCVDHVLSINRAGIEVQRGNFSSWRENRERQDGFEFAENQKLQKSIGQLEQAAKKTASWSDAVEKTKYATRDSGLRPDRGYIGHKAAKMMKRAKSAERRIERAAEQQKGLLKNVEKQEFLKIHPLAHHADLLVSFSDVSISYGGDTVVENINFDVRGGERVALSGKNGAGKSSALKLILGEPIDHTGRVALASGLVVSYLPQDTGFLRGDLMDFAKREGVDETLFLTILRKFDFERAQFEKDMAGYSTGQKKKVLIARSLSQSAHLYVWDEPLNFVDFISRIQLEQLIAEHKPSMLLVEHDRAFLEAVGARIVEL